MNPIERRGIRAFLPAGKSLAGNEIGSLGRGGARTCLADLLDGESGVSVAIRRLALSFALVTGVLLTGTVSGALAAENEPHWVKPPIALIVHSTRVLMEVELDEERLATKWEAEYSESEGEWKAVDSGETQAGSSADFIYFGNYDPGEENYAPRQLRHLKPGTQYYAHFVASNHCVPAEPAKQCIAEETVPFKTLPVGKPEVPKTGTNEENVVNFHVVVGLTDTTAEFEAKVETNGSATEYSFEYATSENSSSWKPFTSGAAGAVTVAEDYAEVKAATAGLKPETTYYVRLKLKNGAGEAIQTKHKSEPEVESSSVTTPTAKPLVRTFPARNVTADSAHLTANITPHSSKTLWHLEYAESPGALEKGEGVLVPGAEGSISQAQAEAVGYDVNVGVGAGFAGLSPSTVYYVRAVAVNVCAEGCGSVASEVVRFETSGAPSATTLAVHALHGEVLRLLGAVDPNSAPTSAEQVVTLEGAPTGGTFTLTFKGDTTGEIPYDADPETVRKALEELPSMAGGGATEVTGPAGGPYTVYFGGPNSDVSQPLIEGNGLGLVSLGGGVRVETSQAGGEAYNTHYHFEYVSQKQFEAPGAEGGWADAVSTPEVDAGSGTNSVGAGVDVPGLKAGETYRYRIVASNDAPHTLPVEGAEQSLTVPVPPPAGGSSVCPNEAFRTGLSAHLPDCRAYEQLTPVDKEGAQEPFHYGFGGIANAVVGEDGEHLALVAEETAWGGTEAAGQSPYFFTRDEGAGWLMRGGSPQPETGVYKVDPQLYNANLTQIAFSSEYVTSESGESPDVEYRVGAAGGPYRTVAAVPRQDIPTGAEALRVGWVAANSDFSKLVLATDDRDLTGEESTGTRSGSDLYEYTAGGGLAQLNVNEEGYTIGSCGATLAHGEEEGAQHHSTSGPHSVSVDGSRVFFEAIPSGNCSEPSHLYMRVNGTETVGIGEDQFLAANAEGTRLLLEHRSGEAHEVLLYETQSAKSTVLLTVHSKVERGQLIVSGDLDALYFVTSEQLTPEAPSVEASGGELGATLNVYRVEIPAEAGNVSGESPRFLFQVSEAEGHGVTMVVSPDGRYAYFTAGRILGVPGGATVQGGRYEGELRDQVYRYDSAESSVECIPCASASDSEPRQPAFLDGVDGLPYTNGGLPDYTPVSANGDFAFFTTPAALVPQDVDGEIEIEKEDAEEYTETGRTTSPSSDIYEWRRDGIDGCGDSQGCLALITDGRGGYLNLLLGMSSYVNGKGETVEGGNVFIYTLSQLLPQDNDTAGDIYDARIDGGFAGPSPRPTECEGDACSTPPSPPSDATPSSLAASGNGNVAPAVTPAANAKSKAKPKKKRKAKPKKKVRAKQKARARARKSDRRRDH